MAMHLLQSVLQPFLQEKNLILEHTAGLSILHTKSVEEGLLFGKTLLYKAVDKKTVFFLSGGRTPLALYKTFAEEEKLEAGAVAMVDERYGDKMHDNSNERMMNTVGFLKYIDYKNIRFYPILEKDVSRVDTALHYDETVRLLLSNFPKSIALLGVGVDGHTAGLPANPLVWQEQLVNQEGMLVVEFDDQGRFYKERVTMTFDALSRMDMLLVLVFGEDKKEALSKMIQPGSLEEVPSRFFMRPGIQEKALFITDQTI